MAEFVFAYHGGKMPETEAEQKALMARWQEWMGGLGDALVNPGAPVGKSWTVSASGAEEGGGANPISGYSLVRADSMQAALDMARGCPHLDHGTVEVAEAMQM